ncbi:MAG: type II/IV secretion system protein [Candidatus Portnoybacteria bacterium]|nr:type II/IV secretion system protein [Candidatus Portnoybacteria bacterium]
MPKSSLTEKISTLHRQAEEERTKNLAKKLNLPYLDFLDISLNPEGLMVVPETEAEKANLIVIDVRGKELDLVLCDPADEATKKILEGLKKRSFRYRPFLVSRSSLRQTLKKYQQLFLTKEKKGGEMEVSQKLLNQFQFEIKNVENLKRKFAEMPDSQTSELLELMIGSALSLDASDVHIEAKEINALVKYRLDGMLHEIIALSRQAYELLLSRIKLLSGMKLNIRDIGQDGRFSIKLKKTTLEVRSSVVPGNYGENIVMRLLDPKTIRLDLEDLGFREDALALIEREIRRPNGLIITTGPTGSGKTTTLYAFVKKIAQPEVKVITLEDPIEYHLSGITQTQIEPKAGYDFPSGLRSILRQDPDILLVGEIRDSETAKTAVNCSLTGHLVFSTLHTNDASGAVPRFIDLGADARSLSSSLKLMMAQRLIRRLCQKCKNPHIPSPEVINKFRTALEDVRHPEIEKATFYQAVGCNECNGLGYKGRIGVLELIPVDFEMEKLIASLPSRADVFELAKKKGMITMYQDALLKVLNGITTLEEVERVVD